MPTFILNLETLEVGNFVDFPPAVPPLVKFLPQDEFDAEMERIQKEKEVCLSQTNFPYSAKLSCFYSCIAYCKCLGTNTVCVNYGSCKGNMCTKSFLVADRMRRPEGQKRRDWLQKLRDNVKLNSLTWVIFLNSLPNNISTAAMSM